MKNEKIKIKIESEEKKIKEGLCINLLTEFFLS